MDDKLRGPLLLGLVDRQRDDEAATSYPQVEVHARNLIELATNRFERPVLVAVGETAQRLLGVADYIGQGHLDIPSWSRDVRGREVLLVGTVTKSLIEFDMQASALRRQGAATVHGCAIHVPADVSTDNLDSFTLLTHFWSGVRRSA